MAENTVFNALNSIDVNEHVEKKNTGKTTLSYLSWVYAWAEVKKRYPDANYEIIKFANGLPYTYDPNTGYMVFTKVTIQNMAHEMWLCVMDNHNEAMLAEPRKVKTKTGEFIVDKCTMFDINKTIMRCLTKNLAMFGLGLYIYAGEDLPIGEPVTTKEMIMDAAVRLEQWLSSNIWDIDKKHGNERKVAAKEALEKENYDDMQRVLAYCARLQSLQEKQSKEIA